MMSPGLKSGKPAQTASGMQGSEQMRKATRFKKIETAAATTIPKWL